MFGILLVAGFALWAINQQETLAELAEETPQRISLKLNQLWDIAQESLRDRKYLRAEKALLTILRVDERNATAYNRLGILYAKQQAFSDAIECFEIAQSLESSASSLHNVGLIYFETGNYEKAGLAFEQALSMEEEVASRHIAYAKVQEKLGNKRRMIAALERAIELEPSIASYNALADAYDVTGEQEKATVIRAKLNRAERSHTPPQRSVKQPRKVMF